jgi:hypothetical protein
LCFAMGFEESVIIVLKSGNGVIIVDAGGGTVDLSAYRMNASQGGFEEIAAPDCEPGSSLSSVTMCECNIQAFFKDPLTSLEGQRHF